MLLRRKTFCKSMVQLAALKTDMFQATTPLKSGSNWSRIARSPNVSRKLERLLETCSRLLCNKLHGISTNHTSQGGRTPRTTSPWPIGLPACCNNSEPHILLRLKQKLRDQRARGLCIYASRFPSQPDVPSTAITMLRMTCVASGSEQLLLHLG